MSGSLVTWLEAGVVALTALDILLVWVSDRIVRRLKATLAAERARNLALQRQLNTKTVRERGLTTHFIADRWVPIGRTICLVNPVDFPDLFDKPSGGAS